MPRVARRGLNHYPDHNECPSFRSIVPAVAMFLLAGLLLLGGSAADAAPVWGEVFPLAQPDGTEIQVRIWGDEFYRVVESLDGYTLTRDPRTGFTCYARLAADGQDLVSTGVPVGSERLNRLNLPKHIRIDPSAARARIAAVRAEATRIDNEVMAASQSSPLAAPPCNGNVKGIVLLVDFEDDPWTIPPGDIDDYCNQVGYNGYGNNGSVRDYFFDVSNGNLTYTNFVADAYYRAVHPKTYYEDPSIGYGTRARELVREALEDLDANGFDFSEYDSNGDGRVDAVNCFYAGYVHNAWAEGLWPHSSSVYFSADGVQTYRYQITNIGSSLRLATFCHENGHMICYWPDLYDYDYDSRGVGRFCLMCSTGSAANPVQPCAYLKYVAGWTNTTLLTTAQSYLPVPVTGNAVYKYERPGAPNEYYLIENRQQTGRDTAIPDSGLAIWHVDTYGSNNWQEQLPSQHYEATLVQADGDWDLENNRNGGDSTDLWAAPEYTECGDFTIPNTSWWNGSPSGLTVRNIGVSAPVMTFTFGAAVFCVDAADCDDGNPCTLDECIDNTCVNTLITAKDVNHDGVVNLFDAFCVLDVMAGDSSECTYEDCDVEPCDPNGVVNVFDIFAVLNAIAGVDPCCG